MMNEEKSSLDGNFIEELTRFFFESVYSIGQKANFILDRGLLSSIVYSTFFRRTADISYVYNYLTAKDLTGDIILFYIRAPKEELAERLKTRKEKFFSLEELKMLYDLYDSTVDVLINKGIKIYIVDNPLSKPVKVSINQMISSIKAKENWKE